MLLRTFNDSVTYVETMGLTHQTALNLSGESDDKINGKEN